MSISKKQVLYVAFIFISGLVIGAIAYSVARPLDKKNEDDKKIMQLIDMKIYDPYETGDIDFDKLVKEWITDTKAGYIRV